MINHMLAHKTNISKVKKTEIIKSFFSDDNGMKLRVSNMRKIRKFTNIWKLDSLLLNNHRVKE